MLGNSTLRGNWHLLVSITQHTQDRPREESQHRDRGGGLAMSSLGGAAHSTQHWTVSANTMPN